MPTDRPWCEWEEFDEDEELPSIIPDEDGWILPC